MTDSSFIQSLPELILLIRRDGTLLSAAGGRGIPALRVLGNWDEDAFTPAWPESIRTLIAQLARRAIADRGASEARFELAGEAFEVRVTAMGQDRCACVLRAGPAAMPMDRRVAASARPEPDRRGFLRRLKEAVSSARLRES